MSHSDLVEIVKRSAEFKEAYGKWWGGFIQLMLANKAAGHRSVFWSGLLGLATLIAGLLLKYCLPIIIG